MVANDIDTGWDLDTTVQLTTPAERPLSAWAGLAEQYVRVSLELLTMAIYYRSRDRHAEADLIDAQVRERLAVAVCELEGMRRMLE